VLVTYLGAQAALVSSMSAAATSAATVRVGRYAVPELFAAAAHTSSVQPQVPQESQACGPGLQDAERGVRALGNSAAQHASGHAGVSREAGESLLVPITGTSRVAALDPGLGLGASTKSAEQAPRARTSWLSVHAAAGTASSCTWSASITLPDPVGTVPLDIEPQATAYEAAKLRHCAVMKLPLKVRASVQLDFQLDPNDTDVITFDVLDADGRYAHTRSARARACIVGRGRIAQPVRQPAAHLSHDELLLQPADLRLVGGRSVSPPAETAAAASALLAASAHCGKLGAADRLPNAMDLAPRVLEGHAWAPSGWASRGGQPARTTVASGAAITCNGSAVAGSGAVSGDGEAGSTALLCLRTPFVGVSEVTVAARAAGLPSTGPAPMSAAEGHAAGEGGAVGAPGAHSSFIASFEHPRSKRVVDCGRHDTAYRAALARHCALCSLPRELRRAARTSFEPDDYYADDVDAQSTSSEDEAEAKEAATANGSVQLGVGTSLAPAMGRVGETAAEELAQPAQAARGASELGLASAIPRTVIVPVVPLLQRDGHFRYRATPVPLPLPLPLSAPRSGHAPRQLHAPGEDEPVNPLLILGVEHDNTAGQYRAFYRNPDTGALVHCGYHATAYEAARARHCAVMELPVAVRCIIGMDFEPDAASEANVASLAFDAYTRSGVYVGVRRGGELVPASAAVVAHVAARQSGAHARNLWGKHTKSQRRMMAEAAAVVAAALQRQQRDGHEHGQGWRHHAQLDAQQRDGRTADVSSHDADSAPGDDTDTSGGTRHCVENAGSCGDSDGTSGAASDGAVPMHDQGGVRGALRGERPAKRQRFG
jgi:hypothetical protein